MKSLSTLLVLLLMYIVLPGQTPVPMAVQPGLTYTENFSDIANWTNGFASGAGANRFAPVAINATGTIPSGTRTTIATNNFVVLSAGGVQRGTDQAIPSTSIILLAAGTTDNTNSDAIDFFMNFSGVNAGTLSFDYQVVFNSSGNRCGSLRVYASTDGTTFSELTGAAVLNFPNNVTLNSSVTGVALPASFNNNPNARLRFYYHNGTGGSSGSRPKLSLDNISVTAVGSPCTAPASPSNLTLANITSSSIDGSFSPATPAADEYLVVMSNNNSLADNPVNGTSYNTGDGLGDGIVIARSGATSFTATGLSSSTHYYFFVFAASSFCNGGPLYTGTPLLNDAVTAPGQPPCAAPATQATGLSFGSTTQNSIAGSFTPTAADEYLVVRSTTASLGAAPVNGQNYVAGATIGSGTVVQRTANANFTAGGLAANTSYNFFIFAFNSQNCSGGPAYNTVSPLTGTASTQPLQLCTTPSAQPTNLLLTASNTSISATFTASGGTDNYLIVQSASATLGAAPADNVDYIAGDNLGSGTVVSNTVNPYFIVRGLAAATTYYYFVFASNKNCSGGTKYLAASPLQANITTSNLAVNNYYFGTLHAHSDYSDGNKDNPGYTPADDYLYAMSSLCLDYLGIAEHNHYTANNNPGNKVANYHMGSAQADAFTSAHPGFLALYGMEWGVIDNGGHVIIYGDGMDQLFGWETGSGNWGAANNYDVFVAKSDYTGANGLFKTINDRSASNTFATLAHPNSSDFNNIAGLAYNSTADNAIVGAAVESGPAFSTNTTYTDPASSMSYLSYYQKLLAKGYHVGPVMDHDNHYTTFGRTTRSRTAVIAPALTKTAVVQAMHDMHFYATQDCDTKVDFTINTKIMGSLVTDRYAPNIAVMLTDATTSLSNAVINVMYGVPGSGADPVQVYSATGSSLNFADINLPNLATGYYYIDITNLGSRIITSPIWYTRIDGNTLPVTFLGFAAKKESGKVRLDWSTAQESNSSHFVVQHAADGVRWQDIATVKAAGNSSTRNDYIAYDNNPVNGINYYRLKQVDKDGGAMYSAIRTVNVEAAYRIVAAPNPAKDNIHLYIYGSKTQAEVLLTDAAGKLLRAFSTDQQHTLISTSGLSEGMYILRVVAGGQANTIKIMVTGGR